MIAKKRIKRPKIDQLTFDRHQWGGTRPGAGRKKDPRAGVSHARREELDPHHPVHVTLRLKQGLRTLRSGLPYHVLRLAFAVGHERSGFRLVHYSAQSTHMHMIVEAKDRSSLSRGLQALQVRIARSLNRVWKRTGSVFADRYFARILRSPRQVRNALCYVLNNARKHGLKLPADMPDPFTSGDSFDGWRERFADEPEDCSAGLVARARTWLLRTGWRRHGLISLAASPAPP